MKQKEKKYKKDLPILIFNEIASAVGGGGGEGAGSKVFLQAKFPRNKCGKRSG
jgi:hypothetical protein